MMTSHFEYLLNNIYSQKNNYFNYNILDPLLFKSKSFSNTIVWTKTKVSGATTDNWTSLSMLSSIDLDGVYGGVSSINLFNNDLYAFQSKGIARLLFNERVQQQASDGISVELTNGYKIRRAAIDLNIPLITNPRLASEFITAFCSINLDDLQIKSWEEYK